MEKQNLDIYRIEGVEIRGAENLQKVQELNDQGKYVIFAPNHVRPNSVIRQNLALAEDFPKLKAVLEKVGLKTSVLFRGDGDMEIGNSKLMEMIYDLHRKIFSAMGRAYTDGIPLAINAKEPVKAMSRNISSMREVSKTLTEKNLTIFPYGNWFPAREQKFDDLEGSDYVSTSDYQQWRQSIKSGFVRIAKRTGSPVLPVYIDNTDGEWVIEFGEPIQIDKEADNLQAGRLYLDQMKTMRNRNLLTE